MSPPVSAALSSASGRLQSGFGSSLFSSPVPFGSTPSNPLTPEPRIYPYGGGSVTKSDVSPSTPSMISGNGARGGSGRGTHLGHDVLEELRGGPWAEDESHAYHQEVGPARGDQRPLHDEWPQPGAVSQYLDMLRSQTVQTRGPFLGWRSLEDIAGPRAPIVEMDFHRRGALPHDIQAGGLAKLCGNIGPEPQGGMGNQAAPLVVNNPGQSAIRVPTRKFTCMPSPRRSGTWQARTARLLQLAHPQVTAWLMTHASKRSGRSTCTIIIIKTIQCTTASNTCRYFA